MKKNKTIKKPSFAGVFLTKLLCAWIIAALAGTGVYFYSNSLYVREYEAGKAAVIDSIEEAYESYLMNITSGIVMSVTTENGIDLNDLRFLQLFLIWLASRDAEPLDAAGQKGTGKRSAHGLLFAA